MMHISRLLFIAFCIATHSWPRNHLHPAVNVLPATSRNGFRSKLNSALIPNNINITITKNNRIKSNRVMRRSLSPILQLINSKVKSRDITSLISTLGKAAQDKTIADEDFNFLCTKAINALGSARLSRYSQEIILLCEEPPRSPDIILYTAAMSTLTSDKKFADVLQLFTRMKARKVYLDDVAFSCALRALHHCKPWEDSIILLDEAFLSLGSLSLPVFHTALTNLNYGETVQSGAGIVRNRYVHLLDWLEEKHIEPVPQTLDIMLSVMCKYGEEEDIARVLDNMRTYNFVPSRITFNTLLTRCTDQCDVAGAKAIIRDMKKFNFTLDEFTCNTLLKLYIRAGEFQAAEKVFEYITEAGFQYSEHTTSLLMQLYRAMGNSSIASRILAEVSDSQVTPYVFCNAIGSCKSVEEATVIFQRAKTLRKVDHAVYTAFAKVLAQNGLFDEAFAYVNEMIAEGYGLNSISMSFIVSVCIGDYDVDSTMGVVKLLGYLEIASQRYPEIFTFGLCQTVVQRLLARREPELACQLHLRYFSDLSCKSETLLDLLVQLQSAAEDLSTLTMKSMLEKRISMGRKALSLLGLYCRPLIHQNSSRKIIGGANFNREKVVKSAHFNSVLRILTLATMYNETEGLFYLMSGYSHNIDTRTKRIDKIEEKYKLNPTRRSLWKPGIFTIAELVRSARISNKPEMALHVISWAIFENSTIPVAVLSDSISFAYDQGRVDIAYEIYEHAYYAGRLQHWTSQSNEGKEVLEIDLHDYSRGMAYAAIRCVFKEILAVQGNSTKDSVLTIITGKNVKGRSEIISSTIEQVSVQSFRISKEIQNVLVEDFYPPISSSTQPGNTGRLIVSVSDVRTSLGG